MAFTRDIEDEGDKWTVLEERFMGQIRDVRKKGPLFHKHNSIPVAACFLCTLGNTITEIIRTPTYCRKLKVCLPIYVIL